MTSNPQVDVIVQRLKKVTGPDKEGWYTALCVFHNDQNRPNLRVNSQGFVCLRCGQKGRLNALAIAVGMIASPASLSDRIVAEYDYRDSDGQLLYQVVRLVPKDFRQRRPDGAGGWTWRVAGIPRVLYRLPELLAADPAEPIFIVEGEKDADRLSSLGFVATCNPGGAGKWDRQYSQMLQGRSLVTLADNDEAGRDHMALVAKLSAGLAKEVRRVILPGLPAKGDMSDWLDSGGTAEELMKLATEARFIEGDALVEEAADQVDEDIGITRRLADAITAKDFFAVDRGRRLYRYAAGVYVPDGDQFVAARVKALCNTWRLSRKWSRHRVKEVEAYIATDAPVLWERPEAGILNLANGVLDLSSLELRSHSPNLLTMVQLPVHYDPSASCPAWARQVRDTIPADSHGVVWEMLAWLILSDSSIQRAVLLQGDGSNGKSTLLRAIRSFLGEHNTTALSLHKIEADRFAAASLLGKLANICSDLPSEHLAGTSIFKAITGGDDLQAEYKYQAPFRFRPSCKLIFSANYPPRSADASFAFFRRWLVLPFGRTFEGEERIPADVLDARLASSSEQSGVLNRALAVLPELQRRGDFLETKSTSSALEEFRSTTDPLAVWLDRHTAQASEAVVGRDALMDAYGSHCASAGIPLMSSKSFMAAVRRLRPSLVAGKRTIDGRRQWCFLGIGFPSTNLTRTRHVGAVPDGNHVHHFSSCSGNVEGDEEGQ